MASLQTLVPYTQSPLCLCTALVDEGQGWGTDLHNLWAHRAHTCVSRHQGASLTNWQEQQRNVFCLPPPHHTDQQLSVQQAPSPSSSPSPASLPQDQPGLSPNTARLAGRDEKTENCTQITISFIPADQYPHSPWHTKLQALMAQSLNQDTGSKTQELL